MPASAYIDFALLQQRRRAAPAPVHLLNCIGGDHYARLLFEQPAVPRAQVLGELEQRLDLCYRGVLRPS